DRGKTQSRVRRAHAHGRTKEIAGQGADRCFAKTGRSRERDHAIVRREGRGFSSGGGEVSIAGESDGRVHADVARPAISERPTTHERGVSTQRPGTDERRRANGRRLLRVAFRRPNGSAAAHV